MKIIKNLDRRGGIHLNKDIRAIFGVEIGDELMFNMDEDKLVITKNTPRCAICDKIVSDSIKFKGQVVCRDCVKAVIQEE